MLLQGAVAGAAAELHRVLLLQGAVARPRVRRVPLQGAAENAVAGCCCQAETRSCAGVLLLGTVGGRCGR